jgi:heme A synthase
VLTWASIVAVFLLMSIGNVVSATGSGLACPDWPLCHGQLIPPMRPDVLIEYSHRVVAALASVLIVASIIVAMRRTAQPVTRRMGWTLIALLAVQIALGGITVLLKLPDLISTAHLVNALLIFAGLLVLAASARPAPVRLPKLARLTRAGLIALLVQLALGGYVRHSGAGLACPDFPLCSGDIFPGHALAVVHWTHRWLGVLLLGLLIHLAIAGWRTPLAGITAVTAALAVVQVSLGIATVLWRLDPALRAAHAAVGYALWAAVVWTAARSGGLAPLTSPTRAIGAMAGARVA